jgi:hypothetical protein
MWVLTIRFCQAANSLPSIPSAHFLSRHTRAFGDLGRIEYSADERRDGLGQITKIERGKNADSSAISPPKINDLETPEIDIETLKGRKLLGKIAQLPELVRNDVCQRLSDGHSYADIAKHLNTLPEVQKVMASKCNGRPIILENVGQWKKRGYVQWLRRREAKNDRAQHPAKIEALAKQSRF